MTRWRGRLRDVALLLLLALAVAKVALGIDRVRDLPLGDEGTFLAQGLRAAGSLSAGEAVQWNAAEWSPLYQAFDGAVALVLREAGRTFDAGWALLTLASAAGIHALARRSGCSPAASWLAAAAPLATSLVRMTPYPSLLYLAIVLLGAVVAASRRTGLARLASITCAFGVASFARPEAVAGFLAGAALLAGMLLRAASTGARRGDLASGLRALLVAVAPAALLGVAFGNPLGGPRSFDAFAQHYAFTVTRREHLPGNPWMAFAGIVRRDFGDAATLGQAIRANPGAVASHVLYNLRELPGNALDLCQLHPSAATPPGAAWIAVSAVLLGVAFVGLVLDLRRSARDRRLPDAATTAFLLACLAAAPGVLLVFPRAHYLVVPAALGAVLAVRGLGTAMAARVTRGGTRAAGARRMVEGAAVVAVLALVPSPLLSGHPPAPIRAATGALRAEGLAGRAVLSLGVDLTAFAGYRMRLVTGWQKAERLSALLSSEGVDVVTLEDSYLAREAFATDPEVAEFLEHPEAFGFRLVYPDDGVVQAYARR